MTSLIRRLPDSELEVMQAVWDCIPPVSRADIEGVLDATQPMAATTILTLLSRLVKRKFLTVDKINRSNYYAPIVSKQDYLASQSRTFVDKLCGGDIRTFATALCGSGIDEKDIEELRRLLERGTL